MIERWYDEKSLYYKMDEYCWPIEQFRFCEKVVSGEYNYLYDVEYNDSKVLLQIYQRCSTFLKNCESRKSIKEKTIDNFQNYQLNGFTKEIQTKLFNWASSII